MNTAVSSFFNWIFLILSGNKDMHKSFDEFVPWPDSTTEYGVSCH